MKDYYASGKELRTNPEQFSPFSEFDDEERRQSYRLGNIPSLTERIVDSSGVKNLVAVFFRVCNSHSRHPFLTFLAYHNCNEEYEFPIVELAYGDDCLETKVDDLIAFVSKRARMKYINKVGYAGSGETRYVLCEVLNNDVPYDGSLPLSFSWLTTGEIVQDAVMGLTICETIRLFIQEVTGACRLFKNETIVPGPQIAYLVCEQSNYKNLAIDSCFKLDATSDYWFCEYDLALLNGFFGTSPIESKCVLRRNRVRNRFYIFRVVLPTKCDIAHCSLELEDMESRAFLKYESDNGNNFVISRNVVEYTGKTDMIYEFLNKKTKPFFLS